MQDNKRTKPWDLAMGFSREEKWGEPQTDRQTDRRTAVGNRSGEPTFLSRTGQQRAAGKQQRATEGQKDRTIGNWASVFSLSTYLRKPRELQFC